MAAAAPTRARCWFMDAPAPAPLMDSTDTPLLRHVATPAPAWLAAGLMGMFGLASWIAINGLFTQLPLFIAVLPEGYALPSELSIAIQVSNVAVLVYLLVPRRPQPSPVGALLVIALGAVGLVLLAPLWAVQTNGHSAALLSLTVVTGAADCLSSAVFLPLVGTYAAWLAVPFAVGEACTGVVATALALVQDPGHANRFSVAVYFALLALIMCASGAALCVVWWHPRLRAHKVVVEEEEVQRSDKPAHGRRPLVASLRAHLLRQLAPELLCTLAINVCENGVMASLLTYAVRPFGDAYYRAALYGGLAAAPLGTLVTLLAPRGSYAVLALVWAPVSVVIVVSARLAKQWSALGALGGCIAAAVVCARFTLGWSKSLVYMSVLRRADDKEAGMLAVGCAQQAGATVGALVFFLLIWFGVVK